MNTNWDTAKQKAQGSIEGSTGDSKFPIAMNKAERTCFSYFFPFTFQVHQDYDYRTSPHTELRVV